MFEQTFVSRREHDRSPAAIALSFAGQALIVLCLMLAPLLRPEALRYVMQRGTLEPPRPLTPAVERAVAASRATASRQVFRPNTLVAPTHVPRHIAMITDPAPELTVEPSAPGVAAASGIFSSLGEIAKPQPPPAPPSVRKPASRVRVSASVQQAMLVYQLKPAYPPLARAARISGTVVLQATIGKDGTIQNLQLMSGHPLLTQAALAAVAQWRYRPTLLNGEPVEVATQIMVNFVLSQ